MLIIVRYAIWRIAITNQNIKILESYVIRKRSCVVRTVVVGKVPIVNSLAAYLTVRTQSVKGKTVRVYLFRQTPKSMVEAGSLCSANVSKNATENTDMFVRSLFIPIFTLGLAIPLVTSATLINSIYTNLSSDHCKTIEVDEETGGSIRRCAGVVGYSLLVGDFDARQSVTILTPDGKQHPLRYGDVVTSAFSNVGEKAEWRVERKGGKVVPIALIVRVYANENPHSPNETTSYLAVAKITPEKICVTQKIKGEVTANEEARQAADGSADKLCLERNVSMVGG